MMSALARRKSVHIQHRYWWTGREAHEVRAHVHHNIDSVLWRIGCLKERALTWLAMSLEIAASSAHRITARGAKLEYSL